MKKLYLVICFISVLSALATISKAQDIVADIAGDKITIADFDREYLKATPDILPGDNISLDKKAEYLNLLINYHLKVRDAKDRGLQYSPDLEKEISGFKDDLLLSYYTDMKVVNPFINQLYERKKYEVRASHILISLTGKYTAEDSIKAYAKFYEVLSRLQNGEDFAMLARIYSDDPSAYSNGGDIYYFTGGQTVPEFEDVAFSLPVRSYSTEPVKTQFGLHLIYVTDRRERVEAIKASHIFVSTTADSTGAMIDSLEAVKKITEIYNQLKNGADFETLAREKSEDEASSINGGSIGNIQRRRLYISLDSALFTLKEGEISGIIKSPAGYHILKAQKIIPVKSIDEEYEEMKSEFKRGYIYKNELNKFSEELLSKSNFQYNIDGLNFLKTKFDTSVVFNKINLDSLLADGKSTVELASFDSGKVIIDDLINYIKSDREAGIAKPKEENLEKFIKESAKTKVLRLAANKESIDTTEQFKSLFNEFVNGLLIFKIDQEELYPSIKISDEDIKSYYEQNKEKYKVTKDGKTEYKNLEDAKPEIMNDLQALKFKETEKKYIDNLKNKYPVTIYEENLIKTLQNLPVNEMEETEE